MVPVLISSLVVAAVAQQPGPLTEEFHPPLKVQECTEAGCEPEDTSIVMDMNWRWLHDKGAYGNCLDDQWDTDLCPDPESCSRNCSLEGVDEKGWKGYGVESIDDGGGLSMVFPKAPRVYLLDGQDTYKIFKLKNREFSFDVDLSSLPCGMNAAAYFVEMPAEGDALYGVAGAKYGTGYCDAQCPHMKFIQGKANSEGWKTHKGKTPEGKWVDLGPDGKYGICCAEMDILEANSKAVTYTAHPCSITGQQLCEGKQDCGDHDEELLGVCDKDGCGWNSFRMGADDFWGPGSEYTIDTTKMITVVTQFITKDGTDDGDLVDIRRLYIQDDKVIKNSGWEPPELDDSWDSLTDDFCEASSEAFNASRNGFGELGGLKAMGDALDRGMVLSLSIWDDNFGRMLWLDGEYSSATEDKLVANVHKEEQAEESLKEELKHLRAKEDVPKHRVEKLRHELTAEKGQVEGMRQELKDDPGVSRGPCSFGFGSDTDLQAYAKKHGGISVAFSNIRYGKIGSTHDAAESPVVKAAVVGDAGQASLGQRALLHRSACAAGALLVVGLLVSGAARRGLWQGGGAMALLPPVAGDEAE